MNKGQIWQSAQEEMCMRSSFHLDGHNRNKHHPTTISKISKTCAFLSKGTGFEYAQ